MFSKKATKIDEIFTVDLTHNFKSTVNIFAVFLENMSCKKIRDLIRENVNALKYKNAPSDMI